MGTINDLNTTDTVADDDKFVLWKTQAGATRAITAVDLATYFGAELEDDFTTDVPDYAGLKALTAAQLTAYSSVMVQGARGGVFEIKTASAGTVTALLATDPGEGVYVALTNGGGTKYAERQGWQDGIYESWWGVVADGAVTAGAISGTDYTTQTNQFLAFLRRFAVTVTDEGTCHGYMVPGLVRASSLNFTGFRGSGVVIHGYRQVLSNAAGKAVIDLLHSRNLILESIIPVGDINTPPRRGFQMGYITSGAVSSSKIELPGCGTIGYFSQFTEYNGGSEEFRGLGGQRENLSASARGICLDAYNRFGRFSDYQTGDLVAKAITGITQANPAVVTIAGHGYSNGQTLKLDEISGMTELNGVTVTVANATTNTFELSGVNSTGYGAYTSGGFAWRMVAYSFTTVSYDNSSSFRPNGGKAVTIAGGLQKLRFMGYTATTNACAFEIITEDAIETRRPNDIEIDIVPELSGAVSVFEFTRGGNENVFTSWRVNLYGWHASDQVFKDDNTANGIYFQDSVFIIGTSTSTPTNGICSPASKFRGGEWYVRAFAGLSNLPTAPFRVEVQDPIQWAFPAGSYPVLANKVSAADITYQMVKGETRWYGTAAGTFSAGAFPAADYTSINGERVLSRNFVRAQFSIADDAFASYVAPGTAGNHLLAISSNAGGGPQGLYYLRTSSVSIARMAAGATPATVISSALTGTTGTDGNWSVGVSTAPAGFIENRSGATGVLQIMTFCGI